MQLIQQRDDKKKTKKIEGEYAAMQKQNLETCYLKKRSVEIWSKKNKLSNFSIQRQSLSISNQFLFFIEHVVDCMLTTIVPPPLRQTKLSVSWKSFLQLQTAHWNIPSKFEWKNKQITE